MSGDTGAEKRIVELGLVLPPAPKPGGNYKTTVTHGNLLYVSGHVPVLPDGSLIKGRVNSDADIDAGYQAARQVGLTMLASIRHSLGSLDRVVRVIKLLGLVNSGPEFYGHPKVINGCSDLLAQVFGDDAGVGTRSAFGVAALPVGVMVEIEGLFEIQV
jgi:enamine deaminase RidA (YjgF/YER057c/UK114 family)